MRPEAERANVADRMKIHIIGLAMAALPLASMAFAFNDKFTAAVACMFVSCVLYTIYYLRGSGQPARIETLMLVVQFFGLVMAACFSFLARLAQVASA